eukprot:SRR837773.10889.p2 GENE.SRR837773.10889~~SRR837773.10889.p2  ORF type:complete len:185 (-),score=48.04 SRR837773.10889:9-521(-)
MAAQELDLDFERADAGAAQTFPRMAGSIKKGDYAMMRGRPCKVVEASCYQQGKHGSTKTHFVGLDLFTGKKYEELCQTSHSMDVPTVVRSEYLLSCLCEEDGSVSVLDLASCELRGDLRLPARALASEPTEQDAQLERSILAGYRAGSDVMVVVLAACGQEKIVAAKVER